MNEQRKAMTTEGQPDSNTLLCTICGAPHRWAWTDIHGVAQCLACGTPYTIYHYDDQNARLNKPPEIEVKPEYIPVLRAYWNETQRRIPSGCSFPGGQELATPDDSANFWAWMESNAEKHLGHNHAFTGDEHER